MKESILALVCRWRMNRFSERTWNTHEMKRPKIDALRKTGRGHTRPPVELFFPNGMNLARIRGRGNWVVIKPRQIKGSRSFMTHNRYIVWNKEHEREKAPYLDERLDGNESGWVVVRCRMHCRKKNRIQIEGFRVYGRPCESLVQRSSSSGCQRRTCREAC